MNPLFTTPIETESDAQAFFFQLDQLGQLFHPEDDPASVVTRQGAPLFNPAEADHLRQRIDEVFAVMDDPCAYCLDLTAPATDEKRSNGPRH
jgi:hypothetical protein